MNDNRCITPERVRFLVTLASDFSLLPWLLARPQQSESACGPESSLTSSAFESWWTFRSFTVLYRGTNHARSKYRYCMSRCYAVNALHPILAFSFFQFSSPHSSADVGLAFLRSYSVEGDDSNKCTVRVVMCSHTS